MSLSQLLSPHLSSLSIYFMAVLSIRTTLDGRLSFQCSLCVRPEDSSSTGVSAGQLRGEEGRIRLRGKGQRPPGQVSGWSRTRTPRTRRPRMRPELILLISSPLSRQRKPLKIIFCQAFNPFPDERRAEFIKIFTANVLKDGKFLGKQQRSRRLHCKAFLGGNL